KLSAIDQFTRVMNSNNVSCLWLGAFTFGNNTVLQAAIGRFHAFFGFVLFKEFLTFRNIGFAQFLLLFFLLGHGFLLNFLHDFLHIFFADARFLAITHVAQRQSQRFWFNRQTAILQIFAQVLTNNIVCFLFQASQFCAVINRLGFFFVATDQARSG